MEEVTMLGKNGKISTRDDCQVGKQNHRRMHFSGPHTTFLRKKPRCIFPRGERKVDLLRTTSSTDQKRSPSASETNIFKLRQPETAGRRYGRNLADGSDSGHSSDTAETHEENKETGSWTGSTHGR